MILMHDYPLKYFGKDVHMSSMKEKKTNKDH